MKIQTILFFSRLFHPHIGGVEKHVWEVSRNLIKKGHKIIVITEKFETDLKLKEKVGGIEVYRIPAGKSNWVKKFTIWKWFWKHRKLIEEADIVHCHDVFFWYFPFRFLFPKKRVYTTFHGYESYPISKKAIFVRRLSEELSFGAICIGGFMEKWYDAKPTFVTYGGVRFGNSKFEIRNSKKGAVFVGRLDEQTGIKTYIEAVKIIKKKIPEFEFLVVGDGKFRQDIEKDVRVLGFKKNPYKYFHEYRFAFASRYLSILEAMAARRLVFALYDNPLKRDYLKMTPFAKFITIVSSKKELADKALYFLKNPRKENEMIEKAFEWVKTQSWNNVSRLYLALWERSVDRNLAY